MKKIAATGIFLIFISLSLCAQPTITPNAHSQQAYENVLALQLTEARTLAHHALLKDPDNYLYYWILDYADCLELMINGNPTQYAKFKSVRDKRLRLMDECAANNPYLNFVNASINFRWSIVHFRFGEQISAMLLFRKAYQQIKENYKQVPHFGPNKMLMGVTMTIAGTIPDEYNWLSSIIGMNGNINKGIALVDEYLNDHRTPFFNLHREALIYQLYLKYYLQHQENWSWAQVNNSSFGAPDNYLEQLVKANLAINYRKGETALDLLEPISTNIKNKYPIFWFQLAQAQQNKLLPAATTSYQNFLYHNKGKWYYKDAWFQIALIHFSNQNVSAAQVAIRKINHGGSQVLDPDKKAHRFSQEPKWPSPELYKAQMLTNGGYYQEALKLLSKITTVKNSLEKAEWSFRLARVYDETGRDDEAIKYYTLSYQLGKHAKEQFAARSALMMGKLFENKNNKPNALLWFKNCLSLRSHDFQTSIDNQAKAGIIRMSGK